MEYYDTWIYVGKAAAAVQRGDVAAAAVRRAPVAIRHVVTFQESRGENTSPSLV